MKTSKIYALNRADYPGFIDPPAELLGWEVHSWHFDQDGWPIVLWEKTLDPDDEDRVQ